jgi:RNA polymerase II subunit A small phosphatase-like protein
MRTKLVVLDLDETLVYSAEQELDRPADLRIVGYHVYLRPHLQEFLDYLFAEFHVGVWTSSGQLYAEPLVEALMPGRPLKFVWSSARCSTARDWETGSYTTQKRLAKLKRLGFRLEEIIGIDDTPTKYARNYGNLVRVPEYTGQPDDDVLVRLMQYLPALKEVGNIRSVEKRQWQQALHHQPGRV